MFAAAFRNELSKCAKIRWDRLGQGLGATATGGLFGAAGGSLIGGGIGRAAGKGWSAARPMDEGAGAELTARSHGAGKNVGRLVGGTMGALRALRTQMAEWDAEDRIGKKTHEKRAEAPASAVKERGPMPGFDLAKLERHANEHRLMALLGIDHRGRPLGGGS